jgi:origin recognition complex subunit 1
MASSKAKMKGWSFHFEGADVSDGIGTRRRRGPSDNKLVLRREADGLEVKAGETVILTDPKEGEQVVMLVKYVDFGTDDYIVAAGVQFFRPADILNPGMDSLEQEIFLTAITETIYCEDIIQKANVLGFEDFSAILIDESNKDNTFLCRRGYDTYYNTFSEEFDIESTCRNMAIDHEAEFEILKRMVVRTFDYVKKGPLIPESHAPKSSSASSRGSHSESERPLPRKRRKLEEAVLSSDNESESGIERNDDSDNSVSSNEEADSDSDSDLSEQEEEEELFPDDDEFRPRPHGKTGRPRGRPRKHPKVENLEKRPRGRPRKHPIDTTPKRKYNKKPKIGLKSLALKKMSNGDLPDSAADTMSELPCREQQFADLYLAIEGAIETDTGTCIFASGTPGTGKTSTAREAVRELYKQSKRGYLNKFNYLEVNGMKLLSAQSAYEIIYKKISNGKRVPATGLSRLLEEYFESGKAEEPLVILMDELDQVATKSQAVTYNILNWPQYQKSKLIVIAVANSMDLPERVLINKTSSRLGIQRIQFPGYTHEDLVQIINSRFSALYDDGIKLKDDAVEFAARKVASVSGDARRALKICQRAIAIATERAHETGHPEDEPVVVQAVHINKAVLESISSPIAQGVQDLSFVGKLLLVAILSKKRKSGLAENSLGDVIDEIKQIVSINTAKNKEQFLIGNKSTLEILYGDFIVRPMGFRFVLNELIQDGIILVQNKKTERNSLVKLGIDDEDITSAFKKDSALQFFAELLA